jgi:hypothetical protein
VRQVEVKEIKSLELDLILRVDFNGVFNKEYHIDEDSNEYETKLRVYQSKYNFTRYYELGLGIRYVRLSDIDDLSKYVSYLMDVGLDEDICCPIGQSIAIFHEQQLLINCDTDTGTCHYFDGHYGTLERIFKHGKTPDDELINFFGEMTDNGNAIYMMDSREDSVTENTKRYCFSKSEFKIELEKLKDRVDIFYKFINSAIKNKENINQELIKEAFPQVFKIRLANYLSSFEVN